MAFRRRYAALGKAYLANIDRAVADARAFHPVATKLVEVLEAALASATEPMQRERVAYALDQVRDIVSPLHPNRYTDMDEQQVERVLTFLGLLSPESEVYRLVVAGVVERTFLATNRFHAVNHARKHYGIVRAEYRFAGGRHEVHGEREDLVTVCGDCEAEVLPCAACDRGEATAASPHVHHECARMHARNARARA